MVAWRAMLARSPNRLVFDTAIRGKCCSSSATIIDCARLDLEILGAKSPTRSLNTNNALVLSSLPSSKIAILSGIERNIHLRLQADPLLQFSYTAWHERAYLQACRCLDCVILVASSNLTRLGPMHCSEETRKQVPARIS